MTWADDAVLGLFLFLGISGGIYVGVRLALKEAGQFVEETITAIRAMAFEVLSNRTLQDLIRAAEKIPKLGGQGGILGGIVKKVGSWLGFDLGG